MNGMGKMPSSKEGVIEVIVFGPGFGECIVVHLGFGQWIVIDSCINSVTGNPVALDFLRSRSVNLDDVRLVVATHWHDDHVGGLSDVLAECRNADFCCSMIFDSDQMLEVASAYNRGGPVSSGLTEIYGSLRLMMKRRRHPIFAISSRPISVLRDAAIDFEVVALSPSDAEVHRFLVHVAANLPKRTSNVSRIPPVGGNDASVALWIRVGDLRMLFGADVEEYGVPDRGWAAIIGSGTRPVGRASYYKIAHHGARSGYNRDIWSVLLDAEPVAVLTPWTNGGAVLPAHADVERIRGHTSLGWSTSRVGLAKPKRRGAVVEKVVREMSAKISRLEPPTGYVSARLAHVDGEGGWFCEGSADACLLTDWPSADGGSSRILR